MMSNWTKEKRDSLSKLAARTGNLRDALDHIEHLEARVEELESKIADFVRESKWCDDSWKEQPHIKALFSIREACKAHK